MSELYRAPEFREKKIETKTMESEFGVPETSANTAHEEKNSSAASMETILLAGDIEVVDDEFLCDFSSQE
jgi:hypothetical protein